MLLSRDGTKAFVCVPKTGTNSVCDVLRQYTSAQDVISEKYGDNHSMIIRFYHNTVEENLGFINRAFPNVIRDNQIQSYGFYRDPVERWCSAVDFHYKRMPDFLRTLETVRNNVDKMEVVDEMESKGYNRIHKDQFGLLEVGIYDPKGTRMINDFYSSDVLTEMANVPWEEFPVDPYASKLFMPQSHWLKNAIILDYSNFNKELEWLVGEWGATILFDSTELPRKNVSEIRKLPVGGAMRKKIMDAYYMDYDLTFHTVS